MRRMDGSIFQAVLFLTTPQRGIVWMKRNVLDPDQFKGGVKRFFIPRKLIPAIGLTTSR